MSEIVTRLRVFYTERNFYSNPQVILVVAPNEVEAQAILDGQNQKDGWGGISGRKLKELNSISPSVTIVEPPGDRNMRY